MSAISAMQHEIGERLASFRYSLSGFRSMMVGMSIPVGVVSGAGLLRSGHVVAAVGVAVGAFLLSGLIMSGFLWIVAALYPVHVHAGGLRSYSLAGTYKNIPWSEVAAISPVRYVGLRYAQVGSTDGTRKVLVPLFLSNMGGFVELVTRTAGPDHPFSKRLRELVVVSA